MKNDTRFARVRGTQQIAEHPVSIDRYERLTLPRSDLICSTDAQALDLAWETNDMRALTALRVEGVTMPVTTTRQAEVKLLLTSLDVYDEVLFYSPHGSSAGYGYGYGRIRSYTHRITPMTAGSCQWTTSLALDFSGAFFNLPGARLDPQAH